MPDIQGFGRPDSILSPVYLAVVKEHSDGFAKSFDLNCLRLPIARQQGWGSDRHFAVQAVGELFAQDRIAAKFAGGLFKPGSQINRRPDHGRCHSFALADIANNRRTEIKTHADFKRRATVGRIFCLPFGNLGDDGLCGTIGVGGRMFEIIKGRETRHHGITDIFFDNPAIGPDL